jgi:hypothetical protein
MTMFRLAIVGLLAIGHNRIRLGYEHFQMCISDTGVAGDQSDTV